MAEVVDQDEVDRLAQAALAHYDVSPGCTLQLINLSENWTYRVEDPESGTTYALRVHRTGYHTPAEIASELLWIDALQQDDVVGTVTPLAARSGERVIQMATETLPERSVVLFAWEEGAPPDPDADLIPVYRTLGAISAGTSTPRSARRATGARGRTPSASTTRSATCSSARSTSSIVACRPTARGPSAMA